MTDRPFSTADVKSAVTENPDMAKAMLEANRQARETRPKQTPIYRDPIFLAAATAIFALLQANFVESRKMQASLIENAVSDDREETISELTFLLDAGLISKWRYGDIVSVAESTFPAVAVLSSFSILDNALDARRSLWAGQRADIFRRNGYYAVAKRFPSFDDAKAFIEDLPTSYRDKHGPYASLVRDWCQNKRSEVGFEVCDDTN